MSRQVKLNEGQVLLDDLNNYRSLDKPMVETTTKKAQQLIKTLLSEGHIDKRMAINGSPLRPILRESPCFTHLIKCTNRHLSEDLLYQGVPDLQNGSQHLLTTLFSQKHNYKLRILKIRQTFIINFIERIKLSKSAIHVSMDVTSLYKKKKHNERVLPLYALHTKNFTKETLQSLPVFKRNA